jgi:hypothetical protein
MGGGGIFCYVQDGVYDMLHRTCPATPPCVPSPVAQIRRSGTLVSIGSSARSPLSGLAAQPSSRSHGVSASASALCACVGIYVNSSRLPP